MPFVSSEPLQEPRQMLIGQIRSLARGETVDSTPALRGELVKLGISVVETTVETTVETSVETDVATGVEKDIGRTHGSASGNVNLGLQQLALAAPLQLLDKARILDELLEPVRRVLGELDVHWVTDSTNNDVLKRTGSSVFHGAVSLAEQQLAGKGRRGKQWISPFGRNVYMSLGWQFRTPVAALSGLSLVTGIAVVDSLRALGVTDVGLKWPNDVILGRGKLGGILVEVVPANNMVNVVLGIGINLALSAVDAQSIDQPWSVVPEGVELSRDQVVSVLLNHLVPALQAFEVTGFAPYAAAWPAYNQYRGQAVEVRLGEQVIPGVDHGIDASGQLLLLTKGGVQSFNAGEVSLRLASADNA